MADQNDNNKNDLVGLPDFHDKNEDAASLDWPVAYRGLYALKPSAFTASAEDVYDKIMALSAMTTVFEDGEITPAREHNERKYPDLMKRLDALANRPLGDGNDA